jgi:uncharacterized iron-regulated membrane protein
MSEETNSPQRGFKGGFRQSMSWLHTWAGLVLSVVLYFMFVTGSVGYFNSEVDRWMRPELAGSGGGAVTQQQMAERALARLQATAPDAKEWSIGLPSGRKNPNLSIYVQPLPGADGKEAEGREELLDPATGQALAQVRKTGGGSALYSMHWALHYMPYEVAMYIVGIATMFMLVSIVTGVVVHKKIFADFFTFRPAKGQRSWLDAHNVASVMALPFFLMITYSGLVFYTYEYMPSVRAALYGVGEDAGKRFDHEADGERYAEPEAAGVKAPLASLTPMLRQTELLWGVDSVEYISVQKPGGANARVRIERRQVERISRSSDALVFNGATGERIALPDERTFAAKTFSNVMLALHEGHFAAPVLRWLYFASGLLGAAMIATGMVLWTAKRRQRLGKNGVADSGLRFVERLNVGTIVGLPIGVAAYFWANRLIPAAFEGRDNWEMHALFITWALCFVHASLRPAPRAWVEQLALAALLYALLPQLNALTTDIHLGRTLPAGDWVLAGFDLTMLALALCFAWALRKAMSKRRRAQQPQAVCLPTPRRGGERLA